MDQSQQDTDAGFRAWLESNPEEMRILIGLDN